MIRMCYNLHSVTVAIRNILYNDTMEFVCVITAHTASSGLPCGHSVVSQRRTVVCVCVCVYMCVCVCVCVFVWQACVRYTWDHLSVRVFKHLRISPLYIREKLYFGLYHVSAYHIVPAEKVRLSFTCNTNYS
jgi:hypothetical protein